MKSQRHLALIGAGYWGKNLARNFNALGALHTLCDLNPEVLSYYGDDYVEVKKTGDVESIWNDPAITQVAIAAPAAHHYRLSKAAILAGKDVFVEKPLCLDVAEAEALVALAREHRRVLMVGHLLQYHSMVRLLLRWANEGVLGDIQYVSSHRLSLGKFRREENVLWSFAPHDLSVILSLAGNREPENVTCQGGSYLTASVEDMTITQIGFSGGLKAHVYANWLNPVKEQKLTVIGSKAMAVFDDTKQWAEKLAIYRGVVGQGPNGPVPNKASPEFAVVAEVEPLREECQHFLDCCHNRATPRTDGAEGLRVLRVLRAAQVDLESRRG